MRGISPLHSKSAEFCSSFARYVDKHRSTAATKGEDIKKGFIILQFTGLYTEVVCIVWHFDISVQPRDTTRKLGSQLCDHVPPCNNKVYISSQGFTIFSPTKRLGRFKPKVGPHLHFKMLLLYKIQIQIFFFKFPPFLWILVSNSSRSMFAS